MTDPTGEFGIVGGLGSAGFEIGMQILWNLANGNSWDCIDWGDVGSAFVVGMFVPPGLSNVIKINNHRKAINVIRSQAGNTANRARKNAERIAKNKDGILESSVELAYSTTQ